ncbi:hypothetical protein GCK32_022024 [Trichostrongylus colubriformis]|uniref:Uncharacterized protein n=1 Tax=Trichostrongylus colubriformis TaxID=6319 RepID=A0AAN8FPS1_TRICO
MAKSDMTQVVALAVISRLHDWCVQLFWITVFCVMGLLRHITSPLLTNLRPVTKSSKKRPASRPPSPQLFDIEEESED